MTKLYLHDASSGLSNLPTTNQSALTAATPVQYPSDAFTVNRTMNRTKGSSTSTYKTCGIDGTSSLKSYYFTRFVSEPLYTTSISANTWNYNFGARVNSTSINYPCSGANQAVYVCCYVWRPGTGKVFTIYEGNSSLDADEPTAVDTAYSEHVTFSGTSGSCQVNDVICLEVWFRIDPASYIAGMQMVFFYDGSQSETTTSGVSYGTDLAYPSYIETPQNLIFTSDVVTGVSDYKDIIRQRPQTLITNSI